MRLRWIVLCICTLVIAATLQLGQASAEVPLDYEIPGGRFFTQANGAAPGAEPTGYAVTNEGGAPLWNEFQRLGGVAALGYPVSRRFSWDGFVVQGFQKGVLQWRPEAKEAWLVNTFDLLSARGKDAWLASSQATPAPLPASNDDGKPWETVLRERQALLDANPAIKKQYFSAANPLTFYGLPTSRVVDNGTHFAMRLQRAVIQQWKVDVPWAKAGQITVANGGEIAKEAGLFPADVIAPDLPPWGAGRIVAIDAGHGGAEIGAAYRFADGTTIAEKDLNLRVALKVEELLKRAGYKPVLTRRTDTEVNKPPKLLTRKPPIGLDDELQARIDIANAAGAQLFLSVHFNGHHDSRLNGAESYYCKERPFAADSLRFAKLVLSNLQKGLISVGYKDGEGSVKDDSQAVGKGQHFYLLGPQNDIIVRPSTMPAVLAEGLFVTNPVDASNLKTEKTLDIIAQAYATAIHQYFAKSDSAQFPILTPTPKPATPAGPPPAQPTPPPPPALGRGTIATEFGGGAFLRVSASASANVIQAIPDGATVDLLQLTTGEAVLPGDTRWYRVRYDGSEGFIYAALVSRPGGTPPPTAAPAPAPATGTGTEGMIATEYGGGAFLRATASSSAPVVHGIPNGAVIQLLQTVQGEEVIAGEARWYRARYDGSEGFVYAALVAKVGGGQITAPPAATIGRARVSAEAGGGAFLRTQASVSSDVVRAVPNGDSVDLLQAVNGQAVIPGETRWYRARYDGSEGYIYGSLVDTRGGNAPPATIGKGTIVTDLGAGAMLRATAATTAAVVRSIPSGDAVEILGTASGQAVLAGDGRWYRARYDGDEGFVYGALVSR